MTVFLIALAAQVLLATAGPVLLARWLSRRTGLRTRMVAIGAATFVASQIVHVPFNLLVTPLLPGKDHALHLLVLATFLGLSSGVCEEVARWIAMRLSKPEERSGPHALLFGAGHGGVEAILIVGLPAILTLINLVYIQRVGVESLGLDDATRKAVEDQLAATAQYAGLAPLLGAVERVFAVTFHIAASLLVMRSVAEGRVRFLFAAIAMHAASNGFVVAISQTYGLVHGELFLFGFTFLSAAVIALSLKALPKVAAPVVEERPAVKGEPIELVGVAKTYGEPPKEVHALKGLDLTLPKGECCALLGPNGAGKTTTIRLITGTLMPTRGHAFVFGNTATDEGFLASKRRLGIVPQQPGMYTEFTVKEYLALVCELYDCAYDAGIVKSLLDDDMLERPMSALSGGMQRRMALAAALLPKPELLVLDEPSAGLDPVAARQMIAAVKKASVGRTTLLCTHNLAEAEELCSSVIILREGRAALHATMGELRTARIPRVALSATNLEVLRAALESRGLEPLLDEDDANTLSVAIEDAERALPTLLGELLAEGVHVIGCKIEKPKLEEVFFSVMEGESS